MPRVSRVLVLCAIAIALSAHAVSAFAAPAGWTSVDVTLHSDDQQSMLLVSGELPPDTKLPAQAELAVPTGAQLQWIGEVLGGDPSKDPEVTYTKSSANGMDVYRFTLAKARTAQAEVTVPGVTSFDGTNYVTGLKWTAWQAIPEVRISQRIAQQSQIVQASPGATVLSGPTGYSYYSKTVTAPKAGDVLDLSFSFTQPAAGTATGTTTTGSSSDTIVMLIVLIAAIGGFGLFIVNVRRKMATKGGISTETPAHLQPAGQADPEQAKPSKKRELQPEPAAEHEPVVEPAPRRIKPAVLLFGLVGVFVVGVAAAGVVGTTGAAADGTLSRDFGSANPCQSASIPFVANEGVDIAKQGEQLLDAFAGMKGVAEVTIDVANSKIDMGWCESSQSEESMRQALSSTGLVSLGQGTTTSAESAPTTATVDPSGKKQTISIDTSNDSFSPSQIVLKAGMPAELAFGQATGCVSEIVITDLGVKQDLSKGPATVRLPALDAGTYDFVCGMGHESGQILVQ